MRKNLIINNQELPLYFEGDSENEKYIRTADLPELHHLDVLGVSEQLRLDHLNNEENDKIKRLISEFSDIFYLKEMISHLRMMSNITFPLGIQVQFTHGRIDTLRSIGTKLIGRSKKCWSKVLLQAAHLRIMLPFG